MKYYSIIWFALIIQKCFILSGDFKCPRNTPLLVKNSGNVCVYDSYNEDNHEISNKIIKIQWLNRRNDFGAYNSLYIASVISSKGDLIIESTIYQMFQEPKERHFYGIKSNGRPFFYEKGNNRFNNQLFLQSTTDKAQFELQMIKIKLTNNDDKDYYLASCFEDNTIDIIDFDNNRVIGKSQSDLFGYEKWASRFYSILELKNENKTYMFCFVGNRDNDNYHYISLQKFKFNKADITKENSYNKIKSSPENVNFESHDSYTLT